jgi:ABC-type nitrate/sulfonate/bicarbonate transport system substrate-binding protein
MDLLVFDEHAYTLVDLGASRGKKDSLLSVCRVEDKLVKIANRVIGCSLRKNIYHETTKTHQQRREKMKVTTTEMILIALLLVSVAISGIQLATIQSLSNRMGGLEDSFTVLKASIPVKVRMGITPWSALASMYQTYAEVRGMWAAAGTKYNVEFEWSWPEEDVANLFYGSVDVIAVGPLEAAELKYNRGFDTYDFGIIHWNEDALIVRGDSPYQNVTDLKGKKLAHFGWDSGAVKYAEVLWKQQYGIDFEKDFEWVVAAPDVCVELLNNKEVEAALVYGGPWTYGVVNYGMRILYGPYTKEYIKLTGHPGLSIESFVTEKTMLDKHPEVARAVNEAWTGTYNYFMQNLNSSTWSTYMDVSYGLNTTEEQAKFREIYPPEQYFPAPGPLTQEIIDSEYLSLTWAFQNGLLDQQPQKDLFFTYTA